MQVAGIPIQVILAFHIVSLFEKWRQLLEIFLPFFTAKELGRQLDGWLEAANFSHGPARAIIAP